MIISRSRKRLWSRTACCPFDVRNKEMSIHACFTRKIAPTGKFTTKVYTSIHQQADGLQNREVLIIDLCKTVNITPKGCHAFTEELCHPFGIWSTMQNFLLQSWHPFGIEHCVTSVI
jgi:hypothetical protein